MLNISENTKFYIVCPAGAQTGGPEALHVLGFELRKLGINAIMNYVMTKEINVDQSSSDVVGERFKIFNVPYVFDIQDEEDNVYVVPEVFPSLLNKYMHVQKVFWWLSVNNYIGGVEAISLTDAVDFDDDSILHLAQSHYAMELLKIAGVKRKHFLSDYLREDFCTQNVDFSGRNRENIILYNPKKGYETTQKIISAAPELNFVSLSDMTPPQLRDLMQKSKIYIDFGHHPGKDRLPREAALQGNIIITGNKGAAAFDEDLPILPKYKLDQSNLDINEVVSLIKTCLQDYDKHIQDFSYYRQWIKLDKEKFIFNLRQLIGR